MKQVKKIKSSGAYYRNIKKKKEEIMQRAEEIRDEIRRNKVSRCRLTSAPSTMETNYQSPQKTLIRRDSICLQPKLPHDLSTSNTQADAGSSTQAMFCNRENDKDFSFQIDDDTCDGDEDDAVTKNHIFRKDLKKWALTHNISHMALKDLMKIISQRFDDKGAISSILPEDPRTLLQTPQTINLIPLSDGEYWHYGLQKCLVKIFCKLDKPITISVMINIDGLPLFKSSKTEFWPILFNIAEMPKVPAMVIGLFCGKSKSTDIDSFLTPLVDELYEMMANGLFINSNKINVRVLCILCDSPARAYIKGVAGFNGHHGCLKCTTVGEYSHMSHANIFPRTECERRTDDKFRQNAYAIKYTFSRLIMANSTEDESAVIGVV